VVAGHGESLNAAVSVFLQATTIGQTMNGYEHYQRAEEQAAKAPSAMDTAAMATLAQVHATLALAAATADATNFKRDLYRGNGEELPAVKRAESKTARDAAAAAAFLD
jgi:hypothetical protein